MNRTATLIVTGVLALTLPAFADTAPYAGQDARAIKALSPERIDGLRTGAGLGYAKAAELNGWPGPLHALELADILSLDADQRADIAAIRQAMLDEAMPLGEELIEAEAMLDALFADGAPDPDEVANATARIGDLDAALRAVHLAAHIGVKPLLTRHQRMLYAQQRGYDDDHQGHGNH